MPFFTSLKNKLTQGHHSSSTSANNLPNWTPAPEISHKEGLWNEAPEDEYEAAEDFCNTYPPQPPRLVPSDAADRIDAVGCRAWGIEIPVTPRFVGTVENIGKSKGGPGVVRISTEAACKDVCLLSDLPILAGLYDTQGKLGVYYEVHIRRMDGIIAIGTACRPYPVWRLPGWNRLSAGLHLDDMRKFFEDPDGGRDYTDSVTGINAGDTIGCGYEFASGIVFFTYNGMRLPPAFTGVYMPRRSYDVFAAVGVEGECEFEVNFGGDYMKWKEGGEWAWRVEGHVGRLGGGDGGDGEELPAYSMGGAN